MHKLTAFVVAISLVGGNAFCACADTLEVCGVSFALPAGWHAIEASTEKSDCSRTVERVADETVSEDARDGTPSIYIDVRPESVTAVAQEWGLRKRRTKWRAEEERKYDGLSAFGVGHWRGVYGYRIARIYSGYRGIGDLPFAIVGNGKRTIFIEGVPAAEDELNEVLRSAQTTNP